MSITTGVVEVGRLDVGEMFCRGAAFVSHLACRLSGYIAAHFGNWSGDGLVLDRNSAVTTGAQNGLEVNFPLVTWNRRRKMYENKSNLPIYLLTEVNIWTYSCLKFSSCLVQHYKWFLYPWLLLHKDQDVRDTISRVQELFPFLLYSQLHEYN